MSRKDVTDGNLAQDMSDANDNFIELYAALEDATAGSGVRVSANDTVLGNLVTKLIAGTSNVTFTVNDEGGNETYSISVDARLVNETDPTLSTDLDGDGNSIINSPVKTQDIGTAAVDQTLDASNYNLFLVEPTADITLDFTNLAAGTVVSLVLTGGGDYPPTFEADGVEANVIWTGGNEPDWATGTTSNVTTFVSPDGTKLVELGTAEVEI